MRSTATNPGRGEAATSEDGATLERMTAPPGIPARAQTVRRLARAALGLLILAGVLAVTWRPRAPQVTATVALTDLFDPVTLAIVEAYRTPRTVVAVVVLLLRLSVPLLAVLTPAGRRLIARLGGRVGWHRPVRAATVVVLAVVIATDLLVLPWLFWLSYVHDGVFGLRTQGLAGWLRDWAAGVLPAWLLVAGLTAAGFALARRLPRAWPEVAAALAAGTVLAVVTLSPLLLEPLHLRTTPLPDGPLRTEIATLTERAGLGDVEVVVADASRRSTRQNAYVSGLGATRRVVLYDTLVAGQPTANVLQVVAHELAHDAHRDVLRGALAGAAAVAAAVLTLGGFVRWRVRRGRQRGDADPRAAAVLLAAVVVTVNLAAPVERALSREVEAAADYGGIVLTEDLTAYRDSRVALARSNLTDPDPPRWVTWLFATHPPVRDRLALAEHVDEGWRGPAPAILPQPSP